MTSPRLAHIALSLLCTTPLLGCSSGSETVDKPVPPGAFALVVDRPLPLEWLSALQPSDAKATARLLVRDELMNLHQARLAPDRVRVIRRAELARRLVELMEDRVAEDSSISKEELEKEYERRWEKYDRPRAVRTFQVIFPVQPPESDDEQFDRAQRVREAARVANNFRQLVDAVRPIIEESESGRSMELPPITADGRIVRTAPQDEQWTAQPPTYLSRAVAELEHPGDVSKVVGSEHGYHVLVAIEILAEKRKPFDQVREEIERAVFAERVDEQLEGFTKDPGVVVERHREDISTLLTLVRRGS